MLRVGLIQALGPMKRFAALLTTLIIGACSNNHHAASAAIDICESQKVDAPFRIPDSLPDGLELWKPTGEQVSVGFRQRGNRRAFCTFTVGSTGLVTRVDMSPGA